jgi:glutamyl-tRNA synthetase
MIRTRFAPSPTGYLHIGGARTALFSWAFARKHGGQFILRIEDTDQERSTKESTDAIFESMKWLGLDWDEGPFFQMDRLARYREVANLLIDSGNAYWCYATPAELEEMREHQRKNGLKPKYDGRWRPENAVGKTPPVDIKPVLRLKNPDSGSVVWDDLVKGSIRVANEELDDFVLLRGDGVPTYNFGVVVDDYDMKLTHIIRGDDHVNNTPRQINVYRALGYDVPKFAHVPMILGGDGERLSKRHGAVSVTQYRDDGYLPGALVNYLARLGWSHGDDEIFNLDNFVDWFDLAGINVSPAKFDPVKLAWVNSEYIKNAPTSTLFPPVNSALIERKIPLQDGPRLEDLVVLLKDRVSTVAELADVCELYYLAPEIPNNLREEFLSPEVLPALNTLLDALDTIDWSSENISTCIKETLKECGLKMPKLAMPLRILLTGSTQTPAIDKLLAIFQKSMVLDRIRAGLKA